MLNHNRTFCIIGSFIGACLANWFADHYTGDRIVFISEKNADEYDLNDAIVIETIGYNVETTVYRLFEKYKFDIVVNFVVSKDIADFCCCHNVCFVQVLSLLDECEYECQKMIRHSICYGINQDSTNFIYTAINNAIKEDYIHTPCNDESVDWIHVNDCCNAIDKVMTFGRGYYEACSGFEINKREIARLVLKEFELPLSFVEYIDDNSESIIRQLNNNRLVSLGWSPNVEFEQTLKSMIRWHRMRG